MSSFNKNIIYSYSAQIVAVLSNFICSILVARMIGPSGQGELGLYTNFMAFLTLLLGMGIPSALVHFIASGKIKKEQVMTLLLFGTILPFVAIFLIFTLLNQLELLSIFLPEGILSSGKWIALLFGHLLFMMFGQYFQSIFQAENNFKLAGITSTTMSISLLFLYTIRYFNLVGTRYEPFHWILYSLISLALLQVIIYKLLLFKSNPSYLQISKINIVNLKPMIVFSSMAFLANLIQFFNYKIDIWFINYYHHSDEMIGVYVLAVSLAQLVWLLPGALHNVLYSYVSGDDLIKEKIIKTQQSAMNLLIYAVVAGIAGYIASIYLVPILFGIRFQEVPSIILILLIGIIPIACALPISAFFAGIQKIKINLYGSILGLILCILFDYILIPTFGIIGAAWATIISYNATVIYYLIQFFRYKRQSVPSHL